MMVSGAVAVVLAFGLLTAVLLHALVANTIEEPDGITIVAKFIGGILLISLLSRVSRTTEQLVDGIELDEAARPFLNDSLARDARLTLVANKRQAGDAAEYQEKEAAQGSITPSPARRTCCSSRSR